jgi:hypothetical protein
MSPALKAGVADHWWTYEELVNLIDTYQPKPINFADLATPMDQLPAAKPAEGKKCVRKHE